MIDVIKREFEILKNNSFVLYVLLLAPIIFSCIIIGTFFTGSLNKLPVSILDEDNSAISRQIQRAVNSVPSAEIKYKVLNLAEGQRLLTEGKAYALIVIPKNFSRDLKRMSVPKIVLYYNNQTILIGGVISKDILTVLYTTAGAVDAATRIKKGLPPKIALNKVNLIRVDEHVKSNPYLNYSYFLTFAAIAHIFQIFAVFISIWSFGNEFKKGTTKEWLSVANDNIYKAVFGKILFYSSIITILMLSVYFGYILLYKAPFEGNVLFFMISSFIFVLAYQLIGMMFVAILSNYRLAMSCGAFYTSLAFTFAGMTFPVMAMPLIGKIYSSFLPIRPFVNVVIDQTMKGIPPIYDIGYLLWISGLGLMGFLSVYLLNKHVYREDLWYQI